MRAAKVDVANTMERGRMADSKTLTRLIEILEPLTPDERRRNINAALMFFGDTALEPPAKGGAAHNPHLLLLDDVSYVRKDQAETSVLFELIAARYERRSLGITANQAFGEWGKVFPDQAMTLAVADRLVHHAVIFEMNVDESYRHRVARETKRGRFCRRAPLRNGEAALLGALGVKLLTDAGRGV
jgi:hypothetical protein